MQHGNDPSADITALVITYNEEPNIERVLEGLTWLSRVVVLDSGSTDQTTAICARFANVDVFTRPFDSFAEQCNYGLSLIHTPWCLSIDADYVLPEETSEQLARSAREGSCDGFEVPLAYCIAGRPLRRALLPPRTVLFRTALGRYEQDGHAHRLVLDGAVGKLTTPILHDDRKPLSRWLASQDQYAAQEADNIGDKPLSELRWPDRVRRLIVVAPWLAPAYYLLARGGLRDGLSGLDYAAQRAIAELVLSLKLLERRRQRG